MKVEIKNNQSFQIFGGNYDKGKSIEIQDVKKGNAFT